MKRVLIYLLLTGCLLTSCSQCPKKIPPYTKQIIFGRDERISENEVIRHPVFQAKVPISWNRCDSSPSQSLLDSTLPNCIFLIDNEVRIAVHSFPSDSLEERIPPEAQIQRWTKQLKSEPSLIERISQSGFIGYYFEGKDMMAWTLQLDPELYQTLLYLGKTKEEKSYYREMASDYTIKVTGSPALLEKHRQDLLFFAKSFELIEEIPSLQ